MFDMKLLSNFANKCEGHKFSISHCNKESCILNTLSNLKVVEDSCEDLVGK